jgi:hypothetical protein
MRVYINRDRDAVMLVVVTISALVVPALRGPNLRLVATKRTMGRQHLRHPPFAFLATSKYRSRPRT